MPTRLLSTFMNWPVPKTRQKPKYGKYESGAQLAEDRYDLHESAEDR